MKEKKKEKSVSDRQNFKIWFSKLYEWTLNRQKANDILFEVADSYNRWVLRC